MRNANRTLVLLVSLLTLTATPAAADPLPPGGSFVDDEENVHESMIEAIAAEGVTKGCNPPENTQYCPGDAVSRGEMAAFMVRALDLPASDTDYFHDDDDSVFEADIQALREAGVTKGCNPPENDRFCPDEPVTRREMAAFLTRAFDYDPASKDHFSDDEGSVFEADINAMADAGVTKGCNPPDNTRFCPLDPVKRDQMASFLGRALELAPVPLPTRMDFLEDFAVTCYTYEDPQWHDCEGEGVWPAEERFYIRHGWSTEEADPGNIGFRLYVDGTRQDLESSGRYEVDGETYESWTKDFPDGMPKGTTTSFRGQWLFDGNVDLSIDLEVTFE